LKSEILSQEQNIVVIRAEHDADAFGKAIESVVREISNHMQIPGFRKGRVPRRILEMRVGYQALIKEAVEGLVPRTIEQLVEEYDLKPIKDPKVDLSKAEEGQPLVLEFRFELRPEVELPEDLSSIEVFRPETAATAEQVEEEIERIRTSKSEERPADRPAEAKDIVLTRYDSFVQEEDGSESPLEVDERGRIDLRQENLRPGIRDALLGRGMGDSTEALVEVEPEYRDPKISGKKVRYAMQVEGVLEIWIPPLDEEHLGLLSENRAQTQEEFRALVAERVKARNEVAADDYVANQAVNELVNRAQVDLPDRLLEEELAARVEADHKRAQEAEVPFEQWLGDQGFETEEAYRAAGTEEARRALRLEFVLDQLAERENVQVEAQDYDREVTRASWMYRVSKADLMKRIEANSQLAHRLAEHALRRKTIRTLAGRVTVKPEVPAAAALSEAPSAEEPGQE
jgi:trigger factor